MNFGIALPAVNLTKAVCPYVDNIIDFKKCVSNKFVVLTTIELGATAIGMSNLGTINAFPIDAPILLKRSSPPKR